MSTTYFYFFIVSNFVVTAFSTFLSKSSKRGDGSLTREFLPFAPAFIQNCYVGIANLIVWCHGLSKEISFLHFAKQQNTTAPTASNASVSIILNKTLFGFRFAFPHLKKKTRYWCKCLEKLTERTLLPFCMSVGRCFNGWAYRCQLSALSRD